MLDLKHERAEGSREGPTVVLAHGSSNTMEHPLIELLFQKIDLDTYRFNFSFVDGREQDVEKDIEELERLLDDIDGEKIVVGKSWGGSVATMLERDDVRKRISLGYLLHEENNPENVYDQSHMDSDVVLVIGDKDRYCDLEKAREVLEDPKIKVVEGTDHSFRPTDGSTQDEKYSKVLEYVREEL